MKALKVFAKGTVVTCPGCKKDIAECIEDCFYDEFLASSKFKNLSGLGPLQGVTRCPFCNEKYGDDGRLHTARGWLPNQEYVKEINS